MISALSRYKRFVQDANSWFLFVWEVFIQHLWAELYSALSWNILHDSLFFYSTFPPALKESLSSMKALVSHSSLCAPSSKDSCLLLRRLCYDFQNGENHFEKSDITKTFLASGKLMLEAPWTDINHVEQSLCSRLLGLLFTLRSSDIHPPLVTCFPGGPQVSTWGRATAGGWVELIKRGRGEWNRLNTTLFSILLMLLGDPLRTSPTNGLGGDERAFVSCLRRRRRRVWRDDREGCLREIFGLLAKAQRCVAE